MCASYSFGCIIAYPSAAITSIKEEFGPFTTFEIATFQSIPAIVAVFAPFLFNIALQRTKIKYISCFIGFFGCASYLLLLVLNRKLFWLGVVIRGLHGVILAGTTLICPLYINLLAPEGAKGFYGAFHSIGINLGHVTSNLIGVAHNWRYPIISASSLLFLHGCLIWFIPDMAVNRKQNSNEEKKKPVICQKKNFKPLFVAIMLMSVNQISGIAGVNQNVSPILKEVGLNIDSGFQAAITQSSQLISIFIVSLLLDKLGPRTMWLISATGNVSSLILYALNVKFDWSPIIPMVALFLFEMFFGLGFSSIPSSVVPTLLTSDIKSFGMTWATVGNRLSGAIMMFLFPYMKEWLGQFGLMICLAVINFLILLFGAFFLDSKIESAKEVKDEIRIEDIKTEMEIESIKEKLLPENHFEKEVKV